MPEEWLSLSEAARLLGIHSSTVRNWSDRGLLPVHRTAGGHRRYRRSEIELWQFSQRLDESSEVNLIVQNALRVTRFQISEGRLASQSWYIKLDDDARDQYRRSGRSLLQGLINYLNSDGDAAVSQAEALGYEYAARGKRYGLDQVDAVHAFLFFRNALIDSMLDVFEAAAVRSPYAWSNLFRKITSFTDEILIALIRNFVAFPHGVR
jgi:excisionase family DNA binding protein